MHLSLPLSDLYCILRHPLFAGVLEVDRELGFQQCHDHKMPCLSSI
jgi:hypothetical protein